MADAPNPPAPAAEPTAQEKLVAAARADAKARGEESYGAFEGSLNRFKEDTGRKLKLKRDKLALLFDVPADQIDVGKMVEDWTERGFIRIKDANYDYNGLLAFAKKRAGDLGLDPAMAEAEFKDIPRSEAFLKAATIVSEEVAAKKKEKDDQSFFGKIWDFIKTLFNWILDMFQGNSAGGLTATGYKMAGAQVAEKVTERVAADPSLAAFNTPELGNGIVEKFIETGKRKADDLPPGPSPEPIRADEINRQIAGIKSEAVLPGGLNAEAVHSKIEGELKKKIHDKMHTPGPDGKSPNDKLIAKLGIDQAKANTVEAAVSRSFIEVATNPNSADMSNADLQSSLRGRLLHHLTPIAKKQEWGTDLYFFSVGRETTTNTVINTIVAGIGDSELDQIRTVAGFAKDGYQVSSASLPKLAALAGMPLPRLPASPTTGPSTRPLTPVPPSNPGAVAAVPPR